MAGPIKAGDAIRIDKTLRETVNGKEQAYDLSNAQTVKAFVQHRDEALVFNGEATIDDAQAGKVHIELTGSQTANIGNHRIEWVVTEADGGKRSFPASGYDSLEVNSPLDRDIDTSEEVAPDLEVTTLTADSIGAAGGPLALTSAVDAQGNDIGNAGAVEANDLVIGDTIYAEDDNSPINVSSTSSTTFNLSNPSDYIIIFIQGDDLGFDQIQVNGDAGPNYDQTSSADTETTGNTEWNVDRLGNTVPRLDLFGDRSSAIRMSVHRVGSGTGETVRGTNGQTAAPINQITFSDSTGTNRTFKARVYRRVIDV